MNPLCWGQCVKAGEHPGDHRHYSHPYMMLTDLRTTHLGGHVWTGDTDPLAWLEHLRGDDDE